MNIPYKKLIAASLLAVISISMMVTATYAWVTLSDSPSLAGVQINIGGDNTIMMAPDLQMEVDGRIIHYPGYFDKTMNVSEEESYFYLLEFTGLSPVSTADGLHWFVLSNSEDGSPNIANLSDFYMDTRLEYANLTSGDEGGYFYLDFWVVSPMDHCTLRISIGEDGTGSYLIQLPEAVADESPASGFRLDDSAGTIGACARVGFLINDDVVTDNAAMQSYVASEHYSDSYKSLKGI